MNTITQGAIALYIHWPFCISKCPYCDFNSHIFTKVDNSLWLKAYKMEIDQYKDFLSTKKIKTIFFGGGTPSLMDPDIVGEVIDYLSPYLQKNVEITLEANPNSSEYNKFAQFKKAGINRISVGVQSFNENDLQKLGRQHSVSEALDAISSAKEIFDKYSFDIIYTRENQSLGGWKGELEDIMRYADGHISLYQLTIEKATPFYYMHKKGELVLPESDLSADMYLHSLEYLRDLGYRRYEISNFAKEGFECRHNLAYWNYDNYLGIGPGAHSRLSYDSTSIMAIMNYHKPEKWLNLVVNGVNPAQSQGLLNNEELIEEILMMGLRLETGIDSKKLKEYLNLNLGEVLDLKAIEKFASGDFLVYDGRNLLLTDKGMLLHSFIVPRIIGR